MKSTASRLPRHFALASALALGLCASAFAHGPDMGRMDKDGDKMISREEAKGHPRLEKDFDAIDTNKDSKLSPDEMKAFREKMHAQRHADGKHGEGKHHDHHARAEEHFQKLDTNKDGKLSKDEIKGQPMLEHNFDRIDANKDGFLAREEIRAEHEARKAERMKNKAESSK